MTDWLFRLQSSLASNQAQPIEWKLGQGTLLLTVHCARALGVALPGVEGNLFWHHPHLEDPTKAAPVLKGGGGLGGDRLWIAPEVGYIFTDLKKARKDPNNNAALPPKMDPGQWRVVENEQGHLRLSADMNLKDNRNGKAVSLRVAREFNAAALPQGLSKKIQSLSFSVRNELTLLAGDPGAVAGVWDLLQIPPTGWLVCPTVNPVKKPTSYYNPFGPKHVKCDKTAVRFLVDGKRKIKMGLTALETTGRMGFYRKVDKKTSTLIFRVFSAFPGEPIVDVPRSSDEFLGADVLQSYNDDGFYGGFGEMEYHDPGIIAGRQPHSRVGVSVTHVLAGPDKDIQAAGKLLLGVKL